MTITFEVRPAADLPVPLRAAGFESACVRALSWLDEDRLLEHLYARPWRASPVAFADTLFAACLVPGRRASDVAALSEGDRTQLRRAVVTVFGQRRAWRALYRSHLTPDERLFAVMLKRYRRRDEVRAHFVAMREEWTQSTAGAAEAAAAFSRSVETMQVKLPQSLLPAVKLPHVNLGLAEVLAPMTPGLHSARSDAVRALSVFRSSVPGSFQERYMGPLSSATSAAGASAAMLDAFNSPALASVKALSESYAVKLAPSFTAGLASASRVSVPWTTVVPPTLVGDAASALRGLAGVAGLARQLESGFLGKAMVGLEGLDSMRRLFEPMKRLQEAATEVAAFERRWEQRALFWLVDRLFRTCDIWVVRGLAQLADAEVEEALLVAIEMAFAPEFVEALRAEVATAPHLNPSQRIHLDHVLEHASAGEYVQAVGSLYLGLEGAFWAAAYAVSAVTVARTRVDKPTKAVGFEGMVKLLGLERQFQTLMVRELWGTTGNVYRHGAADSGERRQVLLGVAALCGWLERFASVPALDALASRMGAELHGAIAAVSSL